eukprot:CAMPEP_0116916812 /NCGR_PEP_ID=MMETSP0467-20121206/18764_1 /TAXON_ID=283647 /ORGANISM="Mesodinium pulex, Strain SPMC105" /LENGTH=52 /DNA_ID=CAMNT_0004593773 /DNA_START=250 /DNA_END=408 /DNA_ORIENTATION=-
MPTVLCPSDGIILDQGDLQNDSMISVKGKLTSAQNILGFNLNATKKYKFCII